MRTYNHMYMYVHAYVDVFLEGASIEDIMLFPALKRNDDDLTFSTAAIVVWVWIVAAAVVIVLTVFLVSHRTKVRTELNS